MMCRGEGGGQGEGGDLILASAAQLLSAPWQLLPSSEGVKEERIRAGVRRHA